MKVLVIDYGMGNLGSVRRSLEECGADVFISEKPADIEQFNKIVIPGVGAFPDGMLALRERGWDEAIRRFVSKKHTTVLGICLGMQLLASKSYENGETAGLNLIPGEIKKLVPDDKNTRVPHVGWNAVFPDNNEPLMAGVKDGSDFYFVHSYHFIPYDNQSIIAKTPYCGEFVSGVRYGQIYGVQFHPEKSSKAGFQLLKNYLNI